MKNKAGIWCYISATICYISGAIYCASLLFLPLAIYFFIYGNRYLRFAKITDGELYIIKNYLTSSAIYVSIFAFPIGLISIIPAFMAGSNNIKVQTNKFEQNNSTTNEEEQVVKADTIEITEVSHDEKKLTEEDLEKIEKLTRFKEQGLLSREEFEEAKNQLLNKK